MALFVFLIKGWYKDAQFSLASYIVGALLFILLSFQCILITGSLKIISDTDYYELQFQRVVERDYPPLADMSLRQADGSDAEGNENPAHRVTLSDYYIGQTEVTQALWQAVMGSNPSNWKGGNLPVEKVSWNDCQQFISKLNQLTGRKFRLPTEAEWEYAARGGGKSRGYKYAGSNDIGSVAWYDGNSSSKTHPVKQKQANELGLYDMSGNVWEWCQDWYDKEYYGKSPSSNPCNNTSASCRVSRGGGWYCGAWICRVSRRGYDVPDDRDNGLGLRLAL